MLTTLPAARRPASRAKTGYPELDKFMRMAPGDLDHRGGQTV